MTIQKDEYIYAVARIRYKESKLLSSKNIDQLISMKDPQTVERFLRDKGWGGGSHDKTTDLIASEHDNLWKLMKELVGDLSAFDFLRIQNDYHNLKASAKAAYTDSNPERLFLSGSVYNPYSIYEAVKNREYKKLPDFLTDTAQEAINALLRTGDGQLCDAIIDKACLSYVYTLGKKSSNEIVRKYCELFVAFSNIKITVRGAQFQKSTEYILQSMADCDTLNIKTLSLSAVKGFDEIFSYLSSTDYKNAVPFIKESLSAFEKWCDNFIMELMKSQKNDPFSIGPLVAYIFAKQTEIKAVRLIMTAKLYLLPDSIIRERVREMYV